MSRILAILFVVSALIVALAACSMPTDPEVGAEKADVPRHCMDVDGQSVPCP